MTRTAKTAVGSRFGKWVVISRTRDSHVECACDCGTVREVHISNLTSGKTKSCGCNRDKATAIAMTKHGMFGTPTYSTWSSMLTRCENPRSKSYQRYGGRGIKVCERWHKFSNFIDDMGEKPSKGMSIERIDNDGNYEPGNCKWATSAEQARNTRRTRLTEGEVLDLRNGIVSINDVVDARKCSKSTAYAAKHGRNWGGL